MGKDGIRRFDDYSMEELLSMPPEELMAAASNRFKLDLPPSIDTVDNLNKLAKLMSKSISEYSYLINMAQIARMRKRALKRSGADKFTVECADQRRNFYELCGNHESRISGSLQNDHGETGDQRRAEIYRREVEHDSISGMCRTDIFCRSPHQFLQNFRLD